MAMCKKSALLFAAVVAASFAEETLKTPINDDNVRVLDVVVQPHEKGKLHEHKANRVMIYRTAGSQEIVYADGRKTVLKFKENQVMWSPREGMHTSEIVSARPVGIVEIELKKPGAGKAITTALDPVQVDPKHYKLEFENDQVRVFRAKYGPHEATPPHEHQLNRIMIALTDTSAKVTGADGKVESSAHKAGDIYKGGPAKHSEVNTLDKGTETIVVELKY